MKKEIIKLIAIPLTSLGAITLTSCNFNVGPYSENSETEPASDSEEEYQYDLNGAFIASDYLTVSQNKVVNQDGDEVILHGVNAGGYLVTEGWMCATSLSNATVDHLNITNTLVERFGKAKTLEIWEYYRENFWNEDDFINVATMNMNVIRLPFTYMSLDPEYNNVPKKAGQEFNFDILDAFIEGAARNSIYVILDLHGAYGSQNGQDHSGQVIHDASDVDFYSNTENKAKTVHLWQEIARHYKDVNSIAAYDILNEPGEKAGTTSTRHWNFYDEIYDAIREVDTRRPLVMESCWDGPNLPKPSVYNWENVIYSFHNYTNETDPASNLTNYQNKVGGVENQNFNVPLQMGEFTLYDSETSWTTILGYLNSHGWHWTTWTYKINRTQKGSTRYGGWGVYYTYCPRIMMDTDSLEEIMEKIYCLDTNHDDVEKMTFSSSVTLETIMRNYC